MNKLKPILAQKFWIFFVLVLILPVVGYSMSKGQLAAQIETRWGKLNETFGKIPTGADSPNDQWSKGLSALNDQLKVHNARAVRVLWEKQLATTRWPKDIAAVMKKAPYFKPPTDAGQASDVQFKYPHDYPGELLKMWEIVDPFDDGINARDTKARRKVIFNMGDLHQAGGGIWKQKWEDLPPTLDEIWAAQEDIWLQTELLKSIERVNHNAQNHMEALVKQIGKITLFGATRVAAAAPDAAAPPGGAPPPGGGFDYAGSGGFGGGRRNDTAALTADIAIAEEFTVTQEAGAGAIGPGSFSQPAAVSETAPAADQPSSSANSGRYIDNDDTRPFKQRGFYFKVIMDHRRVPELLAELMSSPYPVEIVRVHQVWQNAEGGLTPSLGTGPTAGFGGFPNPTGPGGLSPNFPAFRKESAGGLDEGGSGVTPRPTAFPPSGSSGGEGSGTTGSPATSAMADPNLATVAILGVWTLYREPVIDPNQTTPVATPAAPVAGNVAPNAVPAAAVSAPAAGAANSPSPAEEQPKANSDSDTTPNPTTAPAEKPNNP